MSGCTVCHEPGTTTTLKRMGQEECGPEEKGRGIWQGGLCTLKMEEAGLSKGSGMASRS